MKNIATALIAVALLITIGLGCSKTETANDNSNANKTANNSSNDNKSTTSSNSSSAPSSDISGEYTVAGKNPDGSGYMAGLVVKKRDAVYQFTWTTAGHSYEGAGIVDGKVVAVGFSTGSDPEGCGAVIYNLSGTSMNGTFASYGINSIATQTATLASHTDTVGKFDLEGTDTDGSPLNGTLEVSHKEKVVQLTYTGKATFHGTGTRIDDQLGAGVGRAKCSYAVYEIVDGQLHGHWGTIGSDKTGVEVAARK